MMIFKVRRIATYMELIVDIGDVRVSSGLLDELESINLAKDLIFTAEQLLPAGTGESEFNLSKIREGL